MNPSSEPKFGNALRLLRLQRGLPQEAFDQVSSRTYVSALERGVKQPTLGKIVQLASVLGVSPLVLIAVSLSPKSTTRAKALLTAALEELSALPD